ncbi:MAG: fumarylacetoacetate hydrolase family protein [Bifidobacteriaceae bacterium]|jgi:acylpyruvate hydrolase|nr:fumarylacetoacetate hydrolase family protein [Bifidobacteriaceae bacterium]
MKLATVRLEDRTQAVRVDGAIATEIQGAASVDALLQDPAWRGRAAQAKGRTHQLDAPGAPMLAPVVTHPSKVLCVGLNYRAHITEMKREMPQYPTLFAKWADCLAGPYDDVPIPPEASGHVDWEGELAVIIGRDVRRARGREAAAAIAGYAVSDDVSMRDWQFRTREWLQGKVWGASTPLGPTLTTPDEMPSGAQLVTRLDGEEMQRGRIDDLVFGPAELVEYCSTILPLRAGDVIITGTPGGVGNARDPQVFLAPGHVVEVQIDGVGTLRNRFVAERVA